MTALPDYADAIERALDGLAPLGETQTVELAAATGRVLAEPIVADRDLPPFNRAQMDGYALRGTEIGRVERFEVDSAIPAGHPFDVGVAPGHCVAIATGAALPDDVDTVIPHEQSDRGNPVRFEVNAIDMGHAVHTRGADARKGDTLLPAGTVMEPRHVGIAASVGRSTVTVTGQPRTTVLTTGDEVVPTAAPVAPHQIRNSNAPMVRALVGRLGLQDIGHHHVADTLRGTTEAIGTALDHSDLLITVGGISAGERDHVPAALDAHGIALSLRGASIQPGKPILVGRAPSGVVVLGLPGNPVSVLACMCLFGWPIARVLGGLDPALPWTRVTLAEPVRPNPRRRAFRPAIRKGDGTVRIPAWAGSGDLAHTAPTHGMVELPVQEGVVEAGSQLRFLLWP